MDARFGAMTGSNGLYNSKVSFRHTRSWHGRDAFLTRSLISLACEPK